MKKIIILLALALLSVSTFAAESSKMKQANEAYVKRVQLELEIAKYNLEQMAQQ